MKAESLADGFAQRFGPPDGVSRAPGRVNLIGEHTDYNEGFVLPVAMELVTRVAFGPASTAGLTVCSRAFPDEEVVIDLGVSSSRRDHWSDYVCGVVRTLEAAGVEVAPGALLIESAVPPGSGLSSSAALEVSVARALLTRAGRDLPEEDIALLCQRAENEFVGARCGIMDQFIACLGRADHALFLDCRSLATSLVPLPASVEIVVLDSGVRHSLAAGEYNRRRAECEAAAAVLGGGGEARASLRDVALPDLEAHRAELGDVLYRRARHVVTENARVEAFVAALRAGDLEPLAGLLAASHRSLRDDYEVSCQELDLLVELAGGQSTLVGCRMTGGGFGGSTVNLVRAGQGETFQEAVGEAYLRETGRRLRGWRTRAADAARLE